MSVTIRLVLVTAPDVALAETLARGLVEAKLAACVNVVPGLTSFYSWEGTLHKDAEVLLLIKTTTGALPELMRFVRERHPAKVPEIVSLPIDAGDPLYLKWLASAVAS